MIRRLLTIAHSYVLGVNRRLAHELARQGDGQWEVTAVAPDRFVGQNDIRPLAFERIDGEPVEVRILKARLTGRVHLFHYERKLRSILREGWDLVHAWEEPYITAGLQISRGLSRGVPLVFRTAQSLNKRYPPPFNWIERYSVGRMSGWICSGTLVETNLLRRPGYADRPHLLAPLGVDLALFRPDPAAGRAIRRALGWTDGGPPVIGYLGRFVPEKGLGMLMRSLDGMRMPWRAVFVGDGPMRTSMQQWAAAHGDRVRICTDVRHDEVPPYVNAMDLLVAPSLTTPRWREQFGRMLIEAMACGVPVVGSDSGEIPHVIDRAGLVVREGDAAAWTGALETLLESPDRRRELGRAGLSRAVERYAWPVIARQTLSFFDSILASRSKPVDDE